MQGKLWIIEPNLWEADRVIADLDTIRQYNPQRFEMEQLTAVIYEDTARHVCVGYKDLATNEFWARGQESQSPVMPPILMCEAAAQLANYYAIKHKLYASQGGLVGLKNVRCRRIAKPGNRLFVLVKLLKMRANLSTCQFQCAVRKQLVCEGIMAGSILSWGNLSQRE